MSAERGALVEKGAEALFYHFHGRDGLLKTRYTWPAPEQHLPWWRAAAAAVINATGVIPPGFVDGDEVLAEIKDFLDETTVLPPAERGLTPEQIKAGATALYSCGVTVPDGVSYADVVRDVVAATSVIAPGCSWCPSGCKSCTEDRDCECYTHQDEPDKHVVPPADGSKP